MGVRNYLIEGVSGTGKTTVAEELQRRGYHVIHGDRELAYVGDPETGEPLDWPAHESVADTVAWGNKHWIWPVDKVRSLIADQRNAMSFFCGASRNSHHFIELFDEVFVLDVDLNTLKGRLFMATDQDQCPAWRSPRTKIPLHRDLPRQNGQFRFPTTGYPLAW
jgi:broad-specificity NMP kinase